MGIQILVRWHLYIESVPWCTPAPSQIRRALHPYSSWSPPAATTTWTSATATCTWSAGSLRPMTRPWASYQIRTIAACACVGNAGNVFPQPWVSDPVMHHGTCVTHVPWCMSGSLTRFLLKSIAGKTFPEHAQPANLRIWEETHRDLENWCFPGCWRFSDALPTVPIPLQTSGTAPKWSRVETPKSTGPTWRCSSAMDAMPRRPG